MSWFQSYVETAPHRPAIVAPTGDVWTYADVDRGAGDIVRLLDHRGAARGDVICALMPNGAELMVAQRGILQRPLYFSPINWHLTPPEIAYILTDSSPRLLLCTSEFAGTARSALALAKVSMDRLVVVDAEPDDPTSLAGQMATLPRTRPATTTAGTRRLYTSGTTGRPKAVLRPLPTVTPERAAALGVERARVYDMDHEGGVYLSLTPMYHAAPLAYADQALDLGHTVVIASRWDARSALELIRRHGVTYTYLVPLMMQDLLALPAKERADINTLRTVVHTAAPCPPHVKRAMIKWLGPILTEIYGGTEGSATSIRSAEWLTYPGSVGRPREGVRLEIRDGDGTVLPPGEIGHIYYANPSLAFVYDHDSEKTAASRIGDAVTLGDIGYVNEEGYLFLCDRAADLVISGGVNIYPAEIEHALKSLPEVADACVIGVPDDRWGESLHAVVVLRADTAVGTQLTDRLQLGLRASIAGFKIPRTFEFVDRLPYSETGKLLRRRLRQRGTRA